MKKKEFKTYREKDVKALEAEVVKLKKEADLTYSKMKAGQEKNTSAIRNLKRDIARILTLIKEKEILSYEENIKKMEEGETEK
jgi:ribosomal protein L29